MAIAGSINMAMLVDRRRPSSTRAGCTTSATTRRASTTALEHVPRRPRRDRSSRSRCSPRASSSSSVGTLAGQVVMQGFIGRRIPLFVRRAITMVPALDRLADRRQPDAGAGAEPGRALVRDPVRADPAGAASAATGALMGALVNRRSTTVAAVRRRDGDHHPQRLPPRGDVRRTERLGGVWPNDWELSLRGREHRLAVMEFNHVGIG